MGRKIRKKYWHPENLIPRRRYRIRYQAKLGKVVVFEKVEGTFVKLAVEVGQLWCFFRGQEHFAIDVPSIIGTEDIT